MLCSIPTPNPNPSWLDRLRSSKGFPVSDDPQDLDQFLSSITDSPPTPNPNPSPSLSSARRPPNGKDRALFDLVTNVLSDLFVMGAPSSPGSRQKVSRKQLNPRVCNGGGSSVGANREVSPSSVNNGGGVGRKRKMKVRKRRGGEGAVNDSDLSGFSRTEVTVIDTSLSPEWKAARVLYRKGLVWKVREKKVVRVGRKKRRRAAGPAAGEKPGGLKVREKNVGGIGGDGLQREQTALLDMGCSQAGKTQDSKEMDDHILMSRRRKFKRSPRIPTSKNSSVLHLKVISQKNRLTGPRNVLKGKKCRAL